MQTFTFFLFPFIAAIYGDSFFEAGSKAFGKLKSNALRVFTINSIGDFVLFLGKVFIVVITILSGMELLRPKDDIHHMWVPLTLAGIFAFLISHCFITVYEVQMQQLQSLFESFFYSFLFLDDYRYHILVFLRRLRNKRWPKPSILYAN